MLYNQLATPIRSRLTIPLHHAGLNCRASVAQDDGATRTIVLEAEQKTTLELEIPARGRTWLGFRAP